MTVNTGYTPSKQNGTGALVDFDFTFKVFTTANVEVYLQTGEGDPEIQTSGFSVALFDQGASGGRVTFDVAPTSDQKVIIGRCVEDTQETPFKTSGDFQAEDHEDSFDKRTLVSQQQLDGINRAMQLQIGSEGVSNTFPNPVANLLVGWDPTGTKLENKTSAEIGEPLPAVVGTYIKRNIANTSYEAKTVSEVALDVSPELDYATDAELSAGTESAKPTAPDTVATLVTNTANCNIQCAPVYKDIDEVSIPLGAFAYSADRKTKISIAAQDVAISTPAVNTTYHLITDISGTMSFVQNETSVYSLSIDDGYKITRTSGARDFTGADVGKYMEIGNTFIVKILSIVDVQNVKVDIIYSSLTLTQAATLENMIIHGGRRLMSLNTDGSGDIYEFKNNELISGGLDTSFVPEILEQSYIYSSDQADITSFSIVSCPIGLFSKIRCYAFMTTGASGGAGNISIYDSLNNRTSSFCANVRWDPGVTVGLLNDGSMTIERRANTPFQGDVYSSGQIDQRI